MPASTLEPVTAALRTALSKNSHENGLDGQLAGSTKKALLTNIEFESAGSYQSSVLDKLKSKYIVLKSAESSSSSNNSSKQEKMGGDETLSAPKHELYQLSAVQLGWSNSTDWSVGAGMVNMGNTCYLNSTLQALFHVPALVNWLMSDKQHMSECEDSGSYCIVCAMRKTLQDSQQRNTNSIRPFLIFNKLRVVCRNLIPGRQEDAHEFLRYLVEAMEKSYLNRFKNHSQFDSRTKETTPLNQILGGYLRSAVRCLDCGHVSTTFQHFQDLLLDIRKAQTLEEALDGYFSRERLDDVSYHCEACQKKVPATKQFSLERAPMVLCIQLKRFSVMNNKITKHLQFKQRLELTKYARNKPISPLVYRLVALVTHMGPTVSCGHYTAVAQAPCGNFYQFDDSMVRPISHQAVFTTNAYIMLYELERMPSIQRNLTTANGTKVKSIIISSNNSITKNNTSKLVMNGSAGSSSSSKMYGPELPPSKLAKLEDQNGTISSSTINNGKGKQPQESASSSESETEQVTPNSIPLSSPSPKRSQPAKNGKLASPLPPQKKSPITHRSVSINNSSSSNSVCSPTASPKDSPATTIVTSTSNVSPVTKLVPYDEDETSSDDCSAHSNSKKVSTKAANGEWKVTSSTDNLPSDGNKSKVQSNDRGTVNELLKMSHGGYGAPVSTWNGNRAQLDKEISNEKREDRKRVIVDEADQPRVKHVKTSNGNYNKSNPGYNPIQEYHSTKNWNRSNSNYRFYNTGGGGDNRHRNRRNFHLKNNYHNNKNYRFRQ